MTRSVFNHRRGAGSDYRTQVLNDGPLLYWRLGEASGTTAEDETANNRDGTYTNVSAGTNFTYAVTGAIANDPNTAVDFDNDASHARVRRAASTDWDNANFSIEAFIKIQTGQTVNFMHIAQVGGVLSSNWRWALCIRGNDANLPLQVRVAGLTAAGMASANTGMSTGTWYHAVLTWDGTDYVFYLNGSAIGTVTASAAQKPQTSVTNQPFVVGSNDEDTPGGAAWNGDLDEVALYDYKLSAARILAHYSAAL